ncbi:MAG: prepilin-type N-terminal cleavage/methylation domain-containing protein [Clostridia bacterium]|nr:prepilin-type N-terminal cleavage/methylation domain-containing protein [Clostridia bacterium]
MKNKKGFTLAELTISLAVLSIIAVGIMTLTASTINNTYKRRLDYLLRNECQSIVNCFSASEGYTFNENLESFRKNLEYYYTEDRLPVEDDEEEIEPITYQDVTFNTTDDVTAKTYTINYGGYDSTFAYGDYDKYTVHIETKYTSNSWTITVLQILNSSSEVMYELTSSEGLIHITW